MNIDEIHNIILLNESKFSKNGVNQLNHKIYRNFFL